MSRQKMCGAVLLLLLLISVVLVGCQSGKDLPFYPMEDHEYNPESLYIDGVQYVRKQELDECARYYSGIKHAWTPAEGIGEQIGVCGDEATQHTVLKIYEVAGDEEHIFLYTCPAHFYSGGVESRLWMQESASLGTPTAETVSFITIDYAEKGTASVQVDDPAMIASLLEAYSGDSLQVPISEDWEFGSLIMHHKDFPFLQYEIEYRYSPELEISYCQNETRLEWLLLPAEWSAVISGRGLPAQGE